MEHQVQPPVDGLRFNDAEESFTLIQLQQEEAFVEQLHAEGEIGLAGILFSRIYFASLRDFALASHPEMIKLHRMGSETLRMATDSIVTKGGCNLIFGEARYNETKRCKTISPLRYGGLTIGEMQVPFNLDQQ